MGRHLMRFIKLFLFLIFIITSHYSQSSAELPELIGTIKSDTINTLFGYRIVPLGDQNDDGYDDFITWGFDFRAYLYYGGSTIDSTTTYSLRFDSVNGTISNVGDLNLDGYDDFTMLGRSQVDWKNNLYYGGPSIDTIRDGWFGDDSLKGQWYSAYTNDINNDGNPEIWSWNIDRGSVAQFELGTDSDSIPDLELTPANKINGIDYAAFAEGITSGDFNGDGKDDLAVNLRPNPQDSLNGQVYLYWGGASFDTIPDMIITRPGSFERTFDKFGVILESLGDVNGDSYNDFFVGNGNSTDSMGFIYFGGTDIDAIPDIEIFEYLERARLAGDLNSDGYNDLITSLALPIISLGYVNIYYGGPDIDGTPDVTINNSDMPEWQRYFGQDCTGIGDYNGDGVNDFAFSAITELVRGKIYIFSGVGPVTDIAYEYEPNLPDNFSLSQNYPNPFNPSTTIEFQLPQREYVTLSIYNTLGQKIRTLINKELSAGSYKIEWDGKNEGGKSVSSGVYLYKLESAETSVSKKMMLLK